MENTITVKIKEHEFAMVAFAIDALFKVSGRQGIDKVLLTKCLKIIFESMDVNRKEDEHGILKPEETK